MGLWQLNRLGFLLLAVLCVGTEQQKGVEAAADGARPHRMLTTVAVSKPSYPTVTTPMSVTADPDSASGSPSPAFPSLAAGGGSWCVASASASPTALQVALDYACGYGADCSPIQQGGSCFNPDTVKDHASYAFNSYYQKNPVPTSCDFGGTATLTTTDPSSGSCQYPSSSGGGQTTMPPPSPTMTPTVPMTPTPMVPLTPTPMVPMTPTSPDTTTPIIGGGLSPPDFGGSTSPPTFGSTSPPDYNDVGAAAMAGQGRVALSLFCVLAATISLHVSK